MVGKEWHAISLFTWFLFYPLLISAVSRVFLGTPVGHIFTNFALFSISVRGHHGWHKGKFLTFYHSRLSENTFPALLAFGIEQYQCKLFPKSKVCLAFTFIIFS